MSQISAQKSVASGGGVIELAANTGVAIPVAGIVNVVGDGTTVTTSAAGNTLTITATNSGDLQTLTGNSGGAISPSAGNINIIDSTTQGTARITGSGSTLTLNYSDAHSNTGLGTNSMVNIASTSTGNTAFGVGTLSSVTSVGAGNTAIGDMALTSMVSGTNNTALGYTALWLLAGNGGYNVGLGAGSGQAYTTTESSNICINSNGIVGESNVLRIGQATGTSAADLKAAYICGISGVNVGSVATVVTEASNQLGTSVLTAGTGISVTPGANTITIANTGAPAFTTTQYDVLVGAASNGIASVGPGTSGQILQSGGASANPAYTTATYPATTTASQLLYSSSANTVAGLTVGDYGVLISSSTGVPSWLANGTTGEILTATTSGTPSWESPAASSITLDGNSGSATGSTLTIETSASENGSSKFVGSGTTLTQTFTSTDSLFNTVIGSRNNFSNMTGDLNTCFGDYSGHALTTGIGNTLIGQGAASTLSTGSNNIIIGSNGLGSSTNLSRCQIIGQGGGANYTGNENNNIIIGYEVNGVAAEKYTMRLGGGTGTSNGNVNATYVGGITGISTTTTSNVMMVDTGNKLGTVAGGATALNTGSFALTVNSGLNVSSAGIMTNAAQPAFLAYKSSNTTNATGDGTVFTVIFDTSVFNRSSSYATGTGVFTAPVTGIYHFDFNCSVFGEGAAHTQGFFNITTTAENFQLNYCNPFIMGTTNNQFNFTGGITCAMTAADTAKCTVQISGGTITVGIGGDASPIQTCFSGYLVC